MEMAEFLELTDYSGEKVLVNPELIIKVCPEKQGCVLFFAVSTGSGNSTSLYCEHVAENYAAVKKKLQQ